MITRVFIVVFVALVLAVSTPAKTLVLRHATAFVGENLERQADCTIEIRDGRIIQIHPEVGGSIAKNATVIDATGKFVLPGFIEMHAHLLLHPWDKDEAKASRC